MCRFTCIFFILEAVVSMLLNCFRLVFLEVGSKYIYLNTNVFTSLMYFHYLLLHNLTLLQFRGNCCCAFALLDLFDNYSS